jgi:hypothetical protein
MKKVFSIIACVLLMAQTAAVAAPSKTKEERSPGNVDYLFQVDPPDKKPADKKTATPKSTTANSSSQNKKQAPSNAPKKPLANSLARKLDKGDFELTMTPVWLAWRKTAGNNVDIRYYYLEDDTWPMWYWQFKNNNPRQVKITYTHFMGKTRGGRKTDFVEVAPNGGLSPTIWDNLAQIDCGPDVKVTSVELQ